MTDYVDRKVPVDLHEWLMCRGPARLAPSLYQYKELNAEPEPLGPGDWFTSPMCYAGGGDERDRVYLAERIGAFFLIWVHDPGGVPEWQPQVYRWDDYTNTRSEPHAEAQSLYDLGIGPGPDAEIAASEAVDDALAALHARRVIGDSPEHCLNVYLSAADAIAGMRGGYQTYPDTTEGLEEALKEMAHLKGYKIWRVIGDTATEVTT